jgi:hypothetical protein
MYQTAQRQVPEYRENITSQTRITLAKTLMQNREEPGDTDKQTTVVKNAQM